MRSSYTTRPYYSDKEIVESITELNDALMTAACQGKVDCVKALLDAKADIHSRSYEAQYTALMVAAESGQAEVIELLCQRKAHVNIQNSNSYSSALSIALGNGSLSIIDSLLTHGAVLRPETDDPENLFIIVSNIVNNKEYKHTLLALNCAVLLEKFLSNISPNRRSFFSDTSLLSKVQTFNTENAWLTSVIHEKSIEYFYQSEPLLNFPRDLIKIIDSYDATPTLGEKIVSNMSAEELAEKRLGFFAKAASKGKKDGQDQESKKVDIDFKQSNKSA